MSDLASLFAEHGLLSVFLGVFIEQVGAPIPSLPFLLLAGMEGVRDGLFAVLALAVAAVASMLADLLWFWAGRRHGRGVLALLCKVSISPDTCVRQSELSFARRGVATLVISKFVPGLSTLAPPMAGALGMSTRSFVIFNLAGSVLWAGSGIALGIVFHRQIEDLLTTLDDLGSAALLVVGALLGLYVAARLFRRMTLSRLKASLPKIEPAELAALLQDDGNVALLDVRANPAGLASADRIAGAKAMDLSRIADRRTHDWPPDATVVTYCACPNDASAVKAAQLLRRHGYQARILNGGIGAWVDAGYALETPGAADRAPDGVAA